MDRDPVPAPARPQDEAAEAAMRAADALLERGDVAGAARTLAAALRADDGHAGLLVAAVFATLLPLSRPALTVELCRRLAEVEPDHPGLAGMQAGALSKDGRVGEALAVLSAAESDAGHRAEVLAAAGLPALAADARGRRLGFLRRRARRRDHERLAAIESAEPASAPPAEPLDGAALAARLEHAAEVYELLERAGEPWDDAARPAGIELLTAAAAGPAPDLVLLDGLARRLSFANRDEEALALIRRARSLGPGSFELVAAELITLRYLDRHYEAAELAEALPEHLRWRPEVREALGDLYADLGFGTLALRAYGPASGLGSWHRRIRRRLWWRCGGPLRRIRNTRANTEEATLSWWQQRSRAQARVLADIAGAEAAPTLRTLTDVHHLRELNVEIWWGRANVVTRLAVGYAATLGAAAWLTVTARRVVHLTPPWALTAGVAGAGLAFLLLRRLYRRTRAEPGDRVLTRVVPALAAVAVAGFAATRLPVHTAGWAELAGDAAMALAGMAGARLAAAGLVRVGEAFALRRYRRGDPRAVALTGVLDTLDDLSRPALRNDMGWRRRRLQTLEQVALTIETDLPAAFAAGDARVARHLRERARCAAAALRELQYQLVAAPPGAWPRLESALRQDASALARGELGLLRVADPPEPASRRRSRRQLAADTARTAVFAALPLAAVLLAQPWLRFNDTILNWSRLAAAAWALLYVLLTADPTVRDKLRTGFALINMGRGLDEPPPTEDRPPTR